MSGGGGDITKLSPAGIESGVTMVIERERYLDDTSGRLISLGVRSRTPEMHSLLTSLTAEERTAVCDAITRSLDEVAAILRAKLAERVE